ncbi:hypothetical protein GT037_009599 [Alternaria burnsii]|uniref:Uncharacterized protein n=1 Tax=Alternaria burnsii TaxID=1187904 RepID=A0A8H7EC53_9PLEO|nr:uncharacterized protein GT037_009599 [Alternaria burnsii]KAF7672568.1 hypothetical protein GT037_009599 [Alternaria burnsii]
MFTPGTCIAKATPPALSGGITGQAVNLNVIPEDIHHLIITEVAGTSPTDVLNVAHSSVTLRDAALPFIYRNVTLTRGLKKSEEQKRYQALVETFREDEHGHIAKHVRSITVTNDVPSDDLIMMLNKVAQHGNFQSLNWKTSAHMSRAVYDMIHATWPQLELRVVTVDRQNAKNSSHRQMDMRLLSSPLLTELTYVVYTEGSRVRELWRSDWPRLSQALAAGGNVRSLRLQNRQDFDGYDGPKIVPDTEPRKLPRLDLASGLRLPRLEELTIEDVRHYGDSIYLWDDDYCRMFLDSIDPSRLRKLDFGIDNPTNFFKNFAGLFPKLKTLSFGLLGREGTQQPARMFLESLDALEHLDVSHSQYCIDDLWPAIEKHRNSLKTLIIGPKFGQYNGFKYMGLSLLETIASTFPNLERLGWHAECDTNASSNHLTMYICANYTFQIDEKDLEVLSSMKLTKLDLYIHIPGKATDYCDQLIAGPMGTANTPPLDEERSVAAAMNIAEVISGSRQKALQWLTLHLSRMTYGDRADRWEVFSRLQIRRNGYTSRLRGHEWDVRGKMDWYGLPSLEEDLLFEEE